MSKSLYILSLLIVSAPMVSAYDFSAINDGCEIFYNIVDENEVEITYKDKYRPTESYADRLSVPSTVIHDGRQYRVTAVGERAFYGCRSLTSVHLPESVSRIGKWALAECDGIAKFTVTKGIEYITPGAFDGCFGLVEIAVEHGNSSFASIDNALYTADGTRLVCYPSGIDGDYTLPADVVAIASGAFYGDLFLGDVTFPEGIREIGDNAFYFCNGLIGISLPGTVESVGEHAFADCHMLRHIHVDPDNACYASAGGVLLDKDCTRLIQSPCAALGMAVIPQTVSVIGEEAFMRNHSVTTVKIPDGVHTIGESAFIDCVSLQTVEIPASVKEIGAMAFALCESMQKVYVANPDPDAVTVGEGAFMKLTATGTTLLVPQGCADAYRNSVRWSDFDLVMEYNSLTQQTIEWPADDGTYSTDSLTVRMHARASSQLPVQYMLAPDCAGMAQIVDNRLVVDYAGDITVIALQPGNLKYAPAEPVVHTYYAPHNDIADIEADTDVVVYSVGRTIVIRRADPDAEAWVYDIKGHCLYHGPDREIKVPASNIYIVRVDGHISKLYVK